ncbi:MAG: DUF1830 domain-containing protein [Cyanobacteria bacterium Co-bin13]|nr:DUF1830 domain-containing protein [Cyanobacteria bacterium Co-bin13]
MSNLASSVSDSSQPILCYYSNHSSHIQIALLVSGLPGLRLEQVLFPGQRWMFWSRPEAALEIYAAQAGKPALIGQYPCTQLQVVEQAAGALVT